MENWAFFCADNGGELTRGWRGDDDQARQLACEKARELGRPVEFVSERSLLRPDDADDDWEPPAGEVVEPE